MDSKSKYCGPARAVAASFGRSLESAMPTFSSTARWRRAAH
jgi:hypothetical protein